MRESNALRGVCVEFREAVMNFPWMDAMSTIEGSLRAWRVVFPAARAVNILAINRFGNVGRREPIIDAYFVHILGYARARLHTVDTSGCHMVTGAAFVHLRGIHTLYMKNDLLRPGNHHYRRLKGNDWC